MSSIKGWFGEKATSLRIWAFLDTKNYPRFHDVIVPAKSGTTQIDHLVVSRYGLFVIETKNMKGWIFGSGNQPKWTQCLYGRKLYFFQSSTKYPFQNPLRQNYRHIKCLSEYLDLEQRYFHSIVFFNGGCSFKTEMPCNVLNSGLTSYIKSYRQVLLSESEVYDIIACIEELKANPELNREMHLESLQERHSSTSKCPKCGSELVLRTAKNGSYAGNQFFGCSSFPKCRYLRNI
jgi:predicted RNA-binding Zn-ribbon protein involved in translation (DUF1610 family)